MCVCVCVCAAICRTIFIKQTLQHNTIINDKRLSCKLVSLLQYFRLLMIAQDGSESIREPINYGKFISQFRPEIITSIPQLERFQKYVEKNVYIV